MTEQNETRAASQPTMLPASAYSDPASYERERSAIFAREWQYVADTAQLAEHGDYIATAR